ncbi:uncharacterized protein FIESC28_05782 [Fusarium coffeatum]|uniref:Cytochrome P450 n=1 Tax=Fusarium coffeatum TaxID=231269 RepID=A0A366RRB3_9HYPO|nr:uncharacterized protein FIESC28_05782 [Fusarium coffeatum]RBR18960.1 hypothetical protein FIESC28_05782 [Fusarium coffeatum]
MAQSPLPHLLALSTAYACILSHNWDCHLLPVFIGSWAFALATHIFIWVSWIYPYHVSELRHVPTVPGFPLWGQYFDIISQECGVPQREWHQRYGPIVRYFFPFGSERLSVAEQSALSRITGDRSNQYLKPWRARVWISRIFGNGLLMAEGDEHRHQRRILLPAFSSQSIKACAPIVWEKALILTDRWHDLTQNAGCDPMTLEVSEWLSRATLDAIGETCFGQDINSLRQPKSTIVASYKLLLFPTPLCRVFQGLRTFFPISRYIPIQPNRDMDRAEEDIANLASRMLRQKEFETREKGNSYRGRQDLISLMMSQDQSFRVMGGASVSFQDKRDQVMTFLGAGHDATAVTLAWSLHLLAKHSTVQRKLRQEIKAHLPLLFGERATCSMAALAAADLDRLPYLNNVCREILRYIPAVPSISRESQLDDVLAGYHVPAGTTVHISPNTINHLPLYWGEKPSEFDPDRWDNLPDCWTPGAFMTFSRGLRACIGRRLLEMLMKVFLCALVEGVQDDATAQRRNHIDRVNYI